MEPRLTSMFTNNIGHRPLLSFFRSVALLGALFIGPALVIGCGDDDSGSSSNVGTQGGGGSSGSNNPAVDDACSLPDACDLIDSEYVSEVLGAELSEGKPGSPSNGADSEQTSCVFTSKSLPIQSSSVNVRCSSYKASLETTLLNPYLAQGYELASGFEEIADQAIWKLTQSESTVNLQLILVWNDTRIYQVVVNGPFTADEARVHARDIAEKAFDGLNSKLAGADQQRCCCQWLVPFGTTGTSVAIG